MSPEKLKRIAKT
jgi:hypothetical protein